MQGGDGKVVPGGWGAMKQDDIKQMGKCGIETGVFMVLEELSIEPGVS